MARWRRRCLSPDRQRGQIAPGRIGMPAAPNSPENPQMGHSCVPPPAETADRTLIQYWSWRIFQRIGAGITNLAKAFAEFPIFGKEFLPLLD